MKVEENSPSERKIYLKKAVKRSSAENVDKSNSLWLSNVETLYNIINI